MVLNFISNIISRGMKLSFALSSRFLSDSDLKIF